MAAERLAMRQIREILRQKCGVLQPRHGVSHGADQSLEEGHRRQVSEKPLHPSGAFAWLGLGRPPRSARPAPPPGARKTRAPRPRPGRPRGWPFYVNGQSPGNINPKWDEVRPCFISHP